MLIYILLSCSPGSCTFVKLPRTFLSLKGNTHILWSLMTLQKLVEDFFISVVKLGHVMVDPENVKQIHRQVNQASGY